MDPNMLLASLAQLSAPGFNRAIGAGDVVPYQTPQPTGASGAGVATPGVSYDPAAAAGGVTNPVAPGGGSFLNNLSALTPLLDAMFQQQQAAAIPSGQGNAQATPLPGAVAGPSSQDLAQQIASNAGGVPIAGSGGVPGISASDGGAPAGAGAPAGSGDSGSGGVVGDGTAGGIGGSAPGGEGGGGGGTGAGPGAGVGDGTAGGIGGSAPGGEGGAPGNSGEGSGDGGGGGAGGAGATVICTELRRQGYLDEIVWQADAAFGRAQTRATRDGYRLWAAPIARGMARSRVLTLVVASLAIPWAKHMAYVMGVRKHDSLVGRCVMAIGLPLCTFLGGRIGVKTGGVQA